MNFKKKAITCAVGAALGSTGAVSQAANIVSMTIEDTDSDGIAGGFAFAAPGSTAYTNFFDSTSSITFTPTFGSPLTISPSSTVGITANGAGEGTATFTAGFIFSGAPFLPTSFNATGTGSNTTTPDGIAGSVNSGDSSLTMSQFHWSGQFGSSLFPLSPDAGFTLNTVSQGTGGGLCPVGSDTVCYTLQWDHFIQPQGGFSGDTVWQLEGVATLDAPIDLGGTPVTTVTAAVLPSSRSVEVASPATAFATIINSGTGDATGCGIAPTTVVDAAFQYQTTDASNILTGSVNTPADILAGQQQNYVFAFTPNSAFAPTDVELAFDCADTDPATVVSGLNTLLLSASATPVADIVALAATINSDGYTDIPGDTGTGVFAVAAVNVGSTDTITASSALSDTGLPVTVLLCDTDPAGTCITPPAPTVTTSIANGATPSFAAFVTGSGTVADDPAANRITVQFEDSGAVVRGATSVAVRTQ